MLPFIRKGIDAEKHQAMPDETGNIMFDDLFCVPLVVQPLLWRPKSIVVLTRQAANFLMPPRINVARRTRNSEPGRPVPLAPVLSFDYTFKEYVSEHQ